MISNSKCLQTNRANAKSGRTISACTTRLGTWSRCVARVGSVEGLELHLLIRPSCSSSLAPHSCSEHFWHSYTTRMSSPASHRSNRSSINGTPQRRRQNAELPPLSSPTVSDANAADEQLQSEASQIDTQGDDAPMQDVTPRRRNGSSQNTSQSQAPPTSSQLFFRSSPTQSQSQSLRPPQGFGGIGSSSPLRQSVTASSDAGTTPRAAQGYGGIVDSGVVHTKAAG